MSTERGGDETDPKALYGRLNRDEITTGKIRERYLAGTRQAAHAHPAAVCEFRSSQSVRPLYVLWLGRGIERAQNLHCASLCKSRANDISLPINPAGDANIIPSVLATVIT